MKRRVLIAIPALIAFVVVPALAGVNTWTMSLPGTAGVTVAIDPVDPAIAYAATVTGIFKTEDRGKNWLLVDPFPNTLSIAVNPRDTTHIIAGNIDFWDYRAYFRLSFDAGATWQDVRPFGWESGAANLVFDPSQPMTVYAALHQQGIGRSVDGGRTWTVSNYTNGLKCCLLDTWTTMDVALAGGTSPTIYAASVYLSSSRDETKTWQHLGGPTLARLEAWHVTVDPSDPARIYLSGYNQPHGGGGAFTSVDSGATWQALETKLGGRITVDPATPTTLYTSEAEWSREEHGILRSTDRGKTWAEFNHGLTNLDINSVTVDATGTLLYASTGVGVFVQEIKPGPRRRATRK